MHIVITCPYDIDLPGGVQSQIIGMARSFPSEYRLTVVAPGRSVPESLQSSSIETVLLGRTLRFRANGSVAPISLSLSSAMRFYRYLSLTVPDVLIIHEPVVPLVGIVALFGRAKMKIGVFHRAGPIRALSLLRPLASLVLIRLDAGVVVSEEARDSVRALIGEQSRSFRRIPNAVDLVRFGRSTESIRRRNSILFLGRHEQRKGLSILLAAFGKLSSEYSLFIIGSGPETERLKTTYNSNDRIHWLGRVSDDRVVKLMHECEIFVAPSLGGESFGVILLEAMAAGIPVVCSDIPGYRRAAENAAVFFEPGDTNQLAAVIELLAKEEPKRRDLARKGLRRALEFDFSVLRQRYVDVIHTKLPGA